MIKYSDLLLKLLDILLHFTCIELKVIEEIPKIKTSTLDIPPKKPGDKINAPIWLLKYLLKTGKVMITDEITKYISKYIWIELAKSGRDAGVTELDEKFYPIINLYLYALKNGYVKNITPLAREDAIRMIINKRRDLITKLSGGNLEKLESKFTLEERVLLNIQSMLNEMWNKIVGVD